MRITHEFYSFCIEISYVDLHYGQAARNLGFPPAFNRKGCDTDRCREARASWRQVQPLPLGRAKRRVQTKVRAQLVTGHR
jgi:hypothetical protein